MEASGGFEHRSCQESTGGRVATRHPASCPTKPGGRVVPLATIESGRGADGEKTGSVDAACSEPTLLRRLQPDTARPATRPPNRAAGRCRVDAWTEFFKSETRTRSLLQRASRDRTSSGAASTSTPPYGCMPALQGESSAKSCTRWGRGSGLRIAAAGRGGGRTRPNAPGRFDLLGLRWGGGGAPEATGPVLLARYEEFPRELGRALRTSGPGANVILRASRATSETGRPANWLQRFGPSNTQGASRARWLIRGSDPRRARAFETRPDANASTSFGATLTEEKKTRENDEGKLEKRWDRPARTSGEGSSRHRGPLAASHEKNNPAMDRRPGVASQGPAIRRGNKSRRGSSTTGVPGDALERARSWAARPSRHPHRWSRLRSTAGDCSRKRASKGSDRGGPASEGSVTLFHRPLHTEHGQVGALKK